MASTNATFSSSASSLPSAEDNRFPEENMTAGRCVKSSNLIDRAISLVKGFNPATQTVDSYADDAVEGVNADSSDVVFLKQVQTYNIHLYNCSTAVQQQYQIDQPPTC